jgi:hypothetical protein
MDFDPWLAQVSTLGSNCVSLNAISTIEAYTKNPKLTYINPLNPPRNLLQIGSLWRSPAQPETQAHKSESPSVEILASILTVLNHNPLT